MPRTISNQAQQPSMRHGAAGVAIVVDSGVKSFEVVKGKTVRGQFIKSRTPSVLPVGPIYNKNSVEISQQTHKIHQSSNSSPLSDTFILASLNPNPCSNFRIAERGTEPKR